MGLIRFDDTTDHGGKVAIVSNPAM